MSEEYKQGSTTSTGERMRPKVQSIYDRQVARCLADIEEVHTLPSVVEERIKRAIEYTAKDIDKINRKESGHGQEKTEESHNR